MSDEATPTPQVVRVLRTFKVPWMNDGQPFDLSPDRVTPYAARASTVHRSAILKASLRDTQALGMTPLAAQAIIEAAKDEADLAQGEALVFWSLVTVDARIRDLKDPLQPTASAQDLVMQRLGLSTYREMTEALNRSDAKPPTAAQAAKAATDPLVQP